MTTQDVRPEDALQDALHLTDLGNCRRFVNDWRHEVRYVPPWKAFVIYDGQRWVMDEMGQAVERAKQTVRGIAREATYAETAADRKALAKHALRSEGAARIVAMLELAKSEPGIPIDADRFDTDPWLLNVANGTLDLHTGVLRPHAVGDLIAKLLPVAYAPNATCPRWLAFLDEIMDGHADLVTFLRTAIGYALTGDTREQVFFILWGAGANGKSTFLRVITALLGDYARQASMDTFMQKSYDGIPNDIARLLGVRFVAASEAEQQRRLAEALIKSLTGGEKIVARFLHKEFFEFTPRFKIFLATNHKPVIRGADHAIWRRIRLIPFTVTIAEEAQDKDLEVTLLTELPGILAWALDGCRQWRDDGLTPPPAVRVATTAYRAEMDGVGAFLADCCDLGAAWTVTKKTLYAAYTQWAQAAGEKPMAHRTLSVALTERGFVDDRTNELRFWTGLTLKNEPSTASPERNPGEDDPGEFPFALDQK